MAPEREPQSGNMFPRMSQAYHACEIAARGVQDADQALEEAQDDVVPVLDDRPSWDLRRSLEDQGSDVYEVPASSIKYRAWALTSSPS